MRDRERLDADSMLTISKVMLLVYYSDHLLNAYHLRALKPISELQPRRAHNRNNRRIQVRLTVVSHLGIILHSKWPLKWALFNRIQSTWENK